MTKKHLPELKVEVVNDRANLIYLSLLEYKREVYLCVIDNVTSSEIGAFVLDYAEQENINISNFLSVATRWFYSKSDEYPLSVELSKHGLTETLAPIYKTFDTTYVSRIIGHAFSYEHMRKSKVRRRRVVAIPESITIKLKRPTTTDKAV